MHAQIKAIIATIRPSRSTPGAVHIDFTSVEHSPMGEVLFDMYYKTNLTDLLDDTASSGYPHNGGQHTFYMHCMPLDAIAYIETMKEELEDKRTRSMEHRQVISELSYISQELHAFRRQHK